MGVISKAPKTLQRVKSTSNSVWHKKKTHIEVVFIDFDSENSPIW